MNGSTDMCSMPGMESMCGSHAATAVAHGYAPEWLLFALALWFLAGGIFYTYRTLWSHKLIAAYGSRDLENEIGHGLCMYSMVTMLEPSILPIPFLVWAIVLGAGSAWFAVRTFTWGLKRPGNKWWWDGIHVAMLGFMALMFAGISSLALNIVAGAFWMFFTWYASYYTYKLRSAGRYFGWLEDGSDLAHITMGIAMLIMTAAPNVLMPDMAHMPGMAGMQGMSNIPGFNYICTSKGEPELPSADAHR